MNALQLQNLSFFYKEKKIFNNLSLDIKKGTITTIIGNNASGKTTLVSLILDKLKYEGKIIGNGKIGTILDNQDEDKSLNELIEEIDIEDVSFFGIKKILDIKIKDLDYNQKQLAYLFLSLQNKPEILLLDDFYIENKIIKKLKKRGITVVILSSNIEDALIADDIVIINDGIVKLEGSKEEIFSSEKKLKELELNLPFIVDLSIKLKYYGLVDKLYFKNEDLVDGIWK